MRLRFILLGLVPGVVPALAGSADAKGANPFTAYAVLKAEPSPPRAGCRVSRSEAGEIRATLYSDETAACPVARVVDDEIQLGELADALAAAHMEQGSKASRGAKPKGMDFKPPLDRIDRRAAHRSRGGGDGAHRAARLPPGHGRLPRLHAPHHASSCRLPRARSPTPPRWTRSSRPP